MPFFERGSRKYLFIHIPKCGGSTIEYHLEKFSKKFFFCGLNPIRPITNTSPQHFPITDLRLFFGNNFWDRAFAVVRDPYERLESEFFYQQKYLNLKKQDFNNWLQDVLSFYDDNPFYLDNHLRPQTYFIDDSVTLFRLEQGFSYIIKAIEAIMKIDSEIVPPRVMKSERQPVTWSRHSLDLVNRYYTNDFTALNYPQR